MHSAIGLRRPHCSFPSMSSFLAAGQLIAKTSFINLNRYITSVEIVGQTNWTGGDGMTKSFTVATAVFFFNLG